MKNLPDFEFPTSVDNFIASYERALAALIAGLTKLRDKRPDLFVGARRLEHQNSFDQIIASGSGQVLGALRVEYFDLQGNRVPHPSLTTRFIVDIAEVPP